MKKLLFALCLLSAHIATSQTYQLLPDSCTFCMFLQSTGGNSWNNGHYGIHPDNDTLLLGNTYTHLNNVNTDFLGQAFAFRQVGNKLYGVVQDSINEYLIMDFDAEVDDTIHNLYSAGFFYDAKVLVKDSLLVNGGVYHHFIQLEGIRVNEQGTWFNYNWEFTWNERALCGFNNTSWGGEDLGGLIYNIPHTLYVISIPYAAPEYCTTDLLYNTPPNVSCVNCVPQTNSLQELNSSELSIVPNPTTDLIELEISESGYHKVEIFDMKGISQYSKSIPSGFHKIDVSQLNNGIYYVSIISNGVMTTGLFIKQ